jgi:serine protease
LRYGGSVDGIGVTTGTPKVYVIFWGSQWQSGQPAGDPMGMSARVQAMFQGIGTNSETWSGVMTQYCEGIAAGSTTCPTGAAHVGYPTGGALAGVWFDASAAAPTNATDHQIGVEAVNGAAHFGNTTAASNRSAQYFVVSPTGTHPGGFGPTGNFCAWHDWNGDTTLNGGAVTSNYGDIAFTNLPYVTDLGASCGQNYVNAGSAGTLDGVTIVGGHEYAETITDQNPAGGWIDAAGYENADKCAWVGTAATVGTGGAADIAFSTGSFAMQGTYANDASGCETSHSIFGVATNDFSMTSSPGAVSAPQGSSNVSTTIGTGVTSGSAQTVNLALSGAPAGVTGTFNPASLTSGGSSTLTFTVGATVNPGTYNLTVTGTGSSTSHTAAVALTVTGNDFTIGASPTSVTVARGSAKTTTISLAPTSGSAAQSVSLSASGLPAGVTAGFSPASVTGTGTATLTLTASSSATTGIATVTVTGTGPSATRSTAVSLTVTLAAGAGVVNGGFETGTLSGWTSSGSTSVGGSGHSGSYAAVVGAKTATNGSSSIVQTFTAPSGATKLSLWYAVHCPDSVTYDWATVTIRDNANRATRTLLGRTCTNTGAWVQVTGSLTAGHSYTLTLTSHDDNYVGDPTYTQYDDVTVQ